MFEDAGPAVPLHAEDFRLLRDLIKDYCGIYFDDPSRYILERRLSRRLEQRQLENFRDYYRFLLYDRARDEELSVIMDNLTVNETYFFREQSQLRAFSEEILAELKEARRKEKKIRIWSAGCSSGEEPYTLAMLALEKGLPARGFEVEIVGSDINQRVLQAARKGIYRRNSFRSIDDYYLKKYFEEEDGCFRIKDIVKRHVNFSCLNLLDPVKMKLMGTVDVVFCRNVLIYFHTGARKKVIGSFYERLHENGYLLLGHAESLINISTAFVLKHLKHDVVYQKPEKAGLNRETPLNTYTERLG